MASDRRPWESASDRTLVTLDLYKAVGMSSLYQFQSYYHFPCVYRSVCFFEKKRDGDNIGLEHITIWSTLLQCLNRKVKMMVWRVKRERD